MVSARLGGAGWDRDHIWGRTREDRVLSNNPQSHSRQDRGTLRPTEIIFGVVRVRTGAVQNPPITLSAGPRDAQTHRDHIWGRTHGDRILSNNPQSHSRQDRGTLRPTEIIFGVARMGTAYSPTTPIMVSARLGGPGGTEIMFGVIRPLPAQNPAPTVLPGTPFSLSGFTEMLDKATHSSRHLRLRPQVEHLACTHRRIQTSTWAFFKDRRRTARLVDQRRRSASHKLANTHQHNTPSRAPAYKLAGIHRRNTSNAGLGARSPGPASH